MAEQWRGYPLLKNGEDALGVTLAVFEGIFVGGVIGGAAGALVGGAPTIGASFSAMMSGTAGAGVMAMSAEAYLVAAGATAVLGNVMFASSNRPGNNKRQNQQFRDAMKELGITNKDQMRRVHDKIRGRNMGYNELLQFIKQVLNLR